MSETPTWPAAGTALPPWELAVTPTLIVSTAIATRDFQDVHHDRDLAVQRGSRDIFLNILTTTGLVQRYVSDWLLGWAGPRALVRGVSVRLGVPAYPYDPLTFTGTVGESVVEEGEQRHRVEVRGSNSLGDHVVATLTVTMVEEGA